MARKQPTRKKAPRYLGYVKWGIALGAIVGAVYLLGQNAGVAYDEEDIRVVSFYGLSDEQRRTALQAANRERCPCGCGMNLAQCVATDMTCPIRESNVEKIKGMVAQARQAGS